MQFFNSAKETDVTIPDTLPIDENERDLIADRIGTSLRNGVYVLALKHGQIKSGERVHDLEEITGVLFALAQSYPDCEVVSAIFTDQSFTLRKVTQADFEQLFKSLN